MFLTTPWDDKGEYLRWVLYNFNFNLKIPDFELLGENSLGQVKTAKKGK